MSVSLRWRLGLAVMLAMTILALYPQLNLWYERGEKWSGAYAFFDTDEAAYSAYLQALIDGRPRKNDPYTGRDRADGAQRDESIFSIQIVPAYALALAARVLKLSSSSIFILLIALTGAASALAIFRLVATVTKDDRIGATAALVVLCLGILVNGQGAARIFVVWRTYYIYLPFLRRYVPGFSFPFYFLMCLFIWRAFTAKRTRTQLLSAVWAGLCFAVMVYSYFYLWTTAIAWVACLALLWIVAKPAEAREKLKPLAIFGALCLLSLIPYFLLLSRRAETVDSVQALTRTRMPDLFQPPEIVGIVSLLILAWGVRRKALDRRAPEILFAASFAVVPFVVFNQQAITGRSLQPLHYEEFIGNYVALVSAVLALTFVWERRADGGVRKLSSKLLLWTALAAFAWGFVETYVATQIFYQFNLPRELIWPAAVRLGQIERQRKAEDGTGDGAGVALTPDMLQADSLPTAGTQAVLWAPHMHIFTGVTLEEDRERFYQHLYYTGVDPQMFKHELDRKNFYYLLAIYGWERANPVLSLHPQPITVVEDDAETRSYESYIASFNQERARRTPLSYLLLSAERAQALPNLDRWYERDAGERAGDFIIYRLRLKP